MQVLNSAYRHCSRSLCLNPDARSLTLPLRAHQCPAHSNSLTFSISQWRMPDEAAVENTHWTASLLLPPSPPPSSSSRESDTSNQHTVWINELNYRFSQFGKRELEGLWTTSSKHRAKLKHVLR